MTATATADAALDPSKQPMPTPRSNARAGALMLRALRALDAELAEAIPRVVHATDDEAIHDLRVAIRRLRTLLKLARPVYGRFHADAVRDAFTRVHRATGSLRDEEVLEETLGDLGVHVGELTEWLHRRKARERALRRAVVARIKAGELARARKMLLALLTLPVDPDRDKPAHKLARKAIERARDEVESLRDVPVEDVTGLHALRIAYKGLRYTAELLAQALPADLAAMAEPASKFQKLLGNVHDVDMAILTIGRARGLHVEARAEALRHLDAERAKKVAKYLDAMKPHAAATHDAEHEAEKKEEAIATRPRLTKSASLRSGKSRAS